MVEDALRDMFTTRVQDVPNMNDPAAPAVRRARAVRRRRTAGTSVAAVLALALSLGGALTARGWWQAPAHLAVGPGVGVSAAPGDLPTPDGASAVPSTAAAVEPAGLDLRVGGEVWTADGRRLVLGGVGPVTRIYRTPLGWVYGGAGEVRLLRGDGTTVKLGSTDAWTLSPDGSVIAFKHGVALAVADVTASGLVPRSSVKAPPGARPVAFLDDRVVITSADTASHDYWKPGVAYRPTWNRKVAAVYGRSGTGGVGLVRDARANVCLGALTTAANGLQVGRTAACELGLMPAGPRRTAATGQAVRTGALAPDGRSLAVPTATGYLLVDVATALSGRPAAVPCPAIGPIAWVDVRTAIGRDQTGAVACHLDGATSPVALPDGLGEEWEFVPALAPPSED
ncbi:MAG TPA: hypothetical protein VGJ53_12550 [Micromonosporaceae bacterium]